MVMSDTEIALAFVKSPFVRYTRKKPPADSAEPRSRPTKACFANTLAYGSEGVV